MSRARAQPSVYKQPEDTEVRVVNKSRLSGLWMSLLHWLGASLAYVMSSHAGQRGRQRLSSLA